MNGIVLRRISEAVVEKDHRGERICRGVRDRKVACDGDAFGFGAGKHGARPAVYRDAVGTVQLNKFAGNIARDRTRPAARFDQNAVSSRACSLFRQVAQGVIARFDRKVAGDVYRQIAGEYQVVVQGLEQTVVIRKVGVRLPRADVYRARNARNDL